MRDEENGNNVEEKQSRNGRSHALRCSVASGCWFIRADELSSAPLPPPPGADHQGEERPDVSTVLPNVSFSGRRTTPSVHRGGAKSGGTDP